MNKKPTYEELEQQVKAHDEIVSENKKLQAKLQRALEKLRGLAELSPAAVMVYQDDHFIYGNKAAETISGYSADQITSVNFWDIVHPDFRELARERGLKRQRGEETVNRYEIKILTKDGSEKWIDLAGTSTTIGGRPAGLISAMDITDRRQAEEAIRKSEEKYRLLAENIKDVIFAFDENMRMTYVSPSVTRLRGYTVEEAMEQSFGDILTPSSTEIACRAFAHEMELERKGNIDLNKTVTLELETSCKDGSTKWTETVLRAIRDKDNKFVNVLAVARDVTERKKAEEERKNLITEREKALSEIKILSGMLPICAMCKKIRNDEGYWEQIEHYIRQNSNAEFSHSLCPECVKRYYPGR